MSRTQSCHAIAAVVLRINNGPPAQDSFRKVGGTLSLVESVHDDLLTQDYQHGGPQRTPSTSSNVKVELAAASVPHPAVTHRPGQAEAASWSRPGGGMPEQATMPLQQGSAAMPSSALEENKGQPASSMASDQRGQLDALRFQPGNVVAPQQAPQQEQLQ